MRQKSSTDVPLATYETVASTDAILATIAAGKLDAVSTEQKLDVRLTNYIGR